MAPGLGMERLGGIYEHIGMDDKRTSVSPWGGGIGRSFHIAAGAGRTLSLCGMTDHSS